MFAKHWLISTVQGVPKVTFRMMMEQRLNHQKPAPLVSGNCFGRFLLRLSRSSAQWCPKTTHYLWGSSVQNSLEHDEQITIVEHDEQVTSVWSPPDPQLGVSDFGLRREVLCPRRQLLVSLALISLLPLLVTLRNQDTYKTDSMSREMVQDGRMFGIYVNLYCWMHICWFWISFCLPGSNWP